MCGSNVHDGPPNSLSQFVGGAPPGFASRQTYQSRFGLLRDGQKLIAPFVMLVGWVLAAAVDALVTRLAPCGVEVVARFFRALGDPARLRLLEFLLGGEHTVTECVQHIGLTQGRVSSHLACLAGCGYVEGRRQGAS